VCRRVSLRRTRSRLAGPAAYFATTEEQEATLLIGPCPWERGVRAIFMQGGTLLAPPRVPQADASWGIFVAPLRLLRFVTPTEHPYTASPQAVPDWRMAPIPLTLGHWRGAGRHGLILGQQSP
jgi:hypothetical protein